MLIKIITQKDRDSKLITFDKDCQNYPLWPTAYMADIDYEACSRRIIDMALLSGHSFATTFLHQIKHLTVLN